MAKLGHEFSRSQWRTLIVLWATYGSFYLCRVNVAQMPSQVLEQLWPGHFVGGDESSGDRGGIAR